MRPIQSATNVALRHLARRRPAILGYHGITEHRDHGDLHRLQVSARRFRLHLELMLEAGFRFVSLQELLDQLERDGTPAPCGVRGLAVVTFDDGLRNNLTVAQPILSELGITATVFVASDFIGGRSPWLGQGGEMLEEQDLRTLIANGWEIGAHTASHADLSQLSYEECMTEISRSVEALTDVTGVRPRAFAYPFGRYGTAALQAVRAVGLRAALTTGGTSWDPHELTRAMISAGDPLPIFALKLTDGYEPLMSSPPARFARNQSRAVRARVRAT